MNTLMNETTPAQAGELILQTTPCAGLGTEADLSALRRFLTWPA